MFASRAESSLSQSNFQRCCSIVQGRSETIDRIQQEQAFDFDAFFYAHYERIARAVARVVGDPARAEDLAAEAFWKLWRTPRAQGENAGGWLYRTAIRMALNELRSDARRNRYESQSGVVDESLTPEEAHAAAEERAHVRLVLAALDERQAELLLLRSSGLSYEEVASAAQVHPASVGTLLSRAQQAFRKEYLKQYGQQPSQR
jgi:RNA polymerase sigma-70 factor (ECF subfamily)